MSPAQVREVVEERRNSVNPFERLKQMSNKKTEVQLEAKEEQIENDEINENPAAQPEAENEQNYHTEEGAE
ncbi:Uncharacterised protein [Mannheimia haemolytica]|uniref:Uncharacterized protein n=1 Tax=Mannheimia haemolytica TaxID=75985 RepID=A0A378N0U2_MANHA|nr:Uncharacterised protein [Mannheimia haemolytica]